MSSAQPAVSPMRTSAKLAPVSAVQRTLAIDIGGTGIKVMLLDDTGQSVSERIRTKTPQPATPKAVLRAISGLAKQCPGFDRISAGFPGVVRNGIVESAPNLHASWKGVALADMLSSALKAPAKVANDADIQGFGAIEGKGVELVITLGTGVGSALFVDGKLVPNLEAGHHPLRKGKTYEDYLGVSALKRSGKKKWNKRLRQAIQELEKMFNYDCLYIGGGNADKIAGNLPANIKTVDNVAGLLGGTALWRNASGN